MKKVFFTLITACLTSSLFAQVQSDLVIKKGVEIENINGLEDDEVWAKVPAVTIDKQFNYETYSLDAYFKMFYTDENIYVLVDVTDDVHYPAWGAGDTKNEWLYDKVEVYFDINDVLKDGKGPAYIGGVMAAGHYQMAPFLKEDLYGVAHEPENIIYGTLNGEVTMCYTLKPGNTGYTMEYRFPMYAFVNDKGEEMDVDKLMNLPNGIGFDVMIVDNDNDGKGRKRAIWKNVGPTEPYSNMDNCGVVTLSPDDVSGIENSTIESIGVYPNPVRSELTIDTKFDKVEFFNVTGQSVNVNQKGQTIDVSNLAKGVYFIKTYENGEVTGTAKVIKE